MSDSSTINKHDVPQEPSSSSPSKGKNKKPKDVKSSVPKAAQPLSTPANPIAAPIMLAGFVAFVQEFYKQVHGVVGMEGLPVEAFTLILLNAVHARIALAHRRADSVPVGWPRLNVSSEWLGHVRQLCSSLPRPIIKALQCIGLTNVGNVPIVPFYDLSSNKRTNQDNCLTIHHDGITPITDPRWTLFRHHMMRLTRLGICEPYETTPDGGISQLIQVDGDVAFGVYEFSSVRRQAAYGFGSPRGDGEYIHSFVRINSPGAAPWSCIVYTHMERVALASDYSVTALHA